jgi:hypothetical protein
MANDELIYRIQFDGASDAEKVLIKLKREMASLTEQTKANKSEQLQASKDLKSGAITQEQYNAIIQKSTQEQIKLELSTKATRTEMQLAEKTVMSNAEALKNNGAQMVANAKATDTSNLSMKQLSAELSKNKKAYQDLTKEERENEAIGGELLKLIEQQDKEYKELHVSIGNNQVMVGSYQDAVNSLLPVMGGLGGQINGVIGTLGQIKQGLAQAGVAMKTSAVATNGTTSSLKLFRIALISTGIGAIVVALGALVAGFASTQKGADAISRALAPVKEIFATLFGLIQDVGLNVFDRLKNAINNPKQALADFMEFLKNQVINRFNGVKNVIIGFAETFQNTFRVMGMKLKKITNDIPIIGAGLGKEAMDKLDKDIKTAEKKVVDGAKKMANGFVDANLGTKNGLDAIIDTAKKVNKAVDDATKRANKMTDLRVQIRQSEITLTRDLERNRRKMEEQKLILENQLLPMEERNKAGKEYMRLLDANIKREGDLSKMKLELARLSMEANDTDDAQKKEYYDMVAENERMLADATGRRIEVQNKLNDFQKQEVANRKKAIEDLAKAEEQARIEREAKQLEENKRIAQEKLAELEFTQKKEAILNNNKLKSEFQLAKEHEQALFNLKMQYAKDLELEELEVKRENQLATLQIERDELAQINTLRQEALAKEKEEKKQTNEQVKQTATLVNDELFKNENRRIEQTKQREIEALNLRRQAGEISAEEFEKKRLEIDRKAFNDKKRLDTSQVLINSAVGASKTIAQMGFVGAIPALIGLAVQTAGQVASIQAQKFRFGGNVGGTTHSRGGTMIEAERGEAVMMREAVNPITAPILSAINTSYGGNPISALNDFKGSNNNSSGGMQTIEVVNVATDTARINTRVKNLQTSKSF